MIVNEVYSNPVRRLKGKFDFANDGQDTLKWLRFMWSWNKDKKARRAAEILGRKIAAWEKKKAQELKDEQHRNTALKILNKLARDR